MAEFLSVVSTLVPPPKNGLGSDRESALFVLEGLTDTNFIRSALVQFRDNAAVLNSNIVDEQLRKEYLLKELCKLFALLRRYPSLQCIQYIEVVFDGRSCTIDDAGNIKPMNTNIDPKYLLSSAKISEIMHS